MSFLSGMTLMPREEIIIILSTIFHFFIPVYSCVYIIYDFQVKRNLYYQSHDESSGKPNVLPNNETYCWEPCQQKQLNIEYFF